MIEKRVYDSLVARIETLATKVAYLNERREKRLKDWLEVCEILGVEKRTLQSYRDKKILPYSQIRHKIYYKPEDIVRVLEQSKQERG